MELLKKIVDFVVAHAGAIGFVATWAGIIFVRWQRRRAWADKKFETQVNFSLSYVVDDVLVIRTLHEAKTSEVWLNEYGISLLMSASKRTTVDNPFLSLPNASDRDFANRAVKNSISERFAHTYVAEALGLPVKTGKFIFAITYERNPLVRTAKLRVLIIEENTLNQLFGPEERFKTINVTNEVHQVRLESLRLLHKTFSANDKKSEMLIDRVILGVVN